MIPNFKVTCRGRCSRPLFYGRSADFFDGVANVAAVHSIEFDQRVFAAVIVDPFAAVPPEHDIVLGSAVTAVCE